MKRQSARIGAHVNTRLQAGERTRSFVIEVFNTNSIFRRNAAAGFLLAVVLFLVSLSLRLSIDHFLPPGFPFLTFFPGVILSAFFAGWRAGALCALLSGIAAWYYFIPPYRTFEIDYPTALALGFYVVVVAVDIALVHMAQVSAARLKDERAVTASLYDEQRTMFQELQHRVANNLAFVASLLNLQKRKMAAEPGAAVAVMDDAVRRLEVMGRIRRRLYDQAAASATVKVMLRDLARDLIEASGSDRISLSLTAPDIRLGLSKMVTLSLLVAEVVTNSLKHAFPDDRAGMITIELEPIDSDRLVLTIKDDGRGIPPGYDPAVSKSLGLRIIQGLAAQLQGEIKFNGGNGTTTRLEFPRGDPVQRE